MPKPSPATLNQTPPSRLGLLPNYDTSKTPFTSWFLVGNGGRGYGDDYWGLYRDYYRDPFLHSLLRTKEFRDEPGAGLLFEKKPKLGKPRQAINPRAYSIGFRV